jgi:hypothetical protein
VKITLPKPPFDLPPATMDETAPRVPIARLDEVDDEDKELLGLDHSDEPRLDITEQEAVAWEKRGE